MQVAIPRAAVPGLEIVEQICSLHRGTAKCDDVRTLSAMAYTGLVAAIGLVTEEPREFLKDRHWGPCFLWPKTNVQSNLVFFSILRETSWSNSPGWVSCFCCVWRASSMKE